MNYKYFVPTPTTQAEAKAMLRQLAHEHHPDAGGTTEAMQQVNAEYSHLVVELEKASQYKRQAAAHEEGRKTAADFNDLEAVGEVLREKINAALDLNMPNVTVELCGLWIWINGDTKPHAAKLNKRTGIGFNFAGEKKAWYYAGVKSFNRQRRSMEEIRNMHGSQQFTRRQRKDEEAQALHA